MLTGRLFYPSGSLMTVLLLSAVSCGDTTDTDSTDLATPADTAPSTPSDTATDAAVDADPRPSDEAT